MKVLEYLQERMRDRNNRGMFFPVDDARAPVYVDAGSWWETRPNIEADDACRQAVAANR